MLNGLDPNIVDTFFGIPNLSYLTFNIQHSKSSTKGQGFCIPSAMKQLILAGIVLAFFSSCSPRIAPDKYWSGKRWTLTEMKGVPVQLSGTRRDAFIEFNESEKKFYGNGGCNQLNGTYTLEKKNIQFRDVISTKMSCPDIEFENLFLNVLNDVDRFEMENDDLLLKDGRKVVLRFRVR